MDKEDMKFSLNIHRDPPGGECRLEVALVETGGSAALFCTVDMAAKIYPLEMPIEDFGQSVMKICGDWESGTYTSLGILDGYALMFSFKDNGKEISLLGANYMPENFGELLEYLHEKCHVPVSSIEEMLIG